VLVADDHRAVRDGLHLMLGLLGMEVPGAAAGGTDAVRQAAAAVPGVVLIDLHMPDCDEVQATRLIARQRPSWTRRCSAGWPGPRSGVSAASSSLTRSGTAWPPDRRRAHPGKAAALTPGAARQAGHESGTNRARLRRGPRGIRCPGDAGVPAVEVTGELAVENPRADLGLDTAPAGLLDTPALQHLYDSRRAVSAWSGRP